MINIKLTSTDSRPIYVPTSALTDSFFEEDKGKTFVYPHGYGDRYFCVKETVKEIFAKAKLK